MRIEMNSGGLLGLIKVAAFQVELKTAYNAVDNVLNAFQLVAQATNKINGGVGNLQPALDCVNMRIQAEKQKVEKIERVQRDVNSFLSLAMRTDTNVANTIRQNQYDFYGKYAWAKPSVKNDDDGQGFWSWLKSKMGEGFSWITKGGKAIGEFIFGGAEALINIFKDAFNGAVDLVSRANAVISKTISSVVNDVKTLTNKVVNVGGKIFNTVKTWGKKAYYNTKSFLTGVWNKVTEWYDLGGKNIIGSGVTLVKDVFKGAGMILTGHPMRGVVNIGFALCNAHLDISNEIDAINLRQQALIMESDGNYLKAQELLAEANAKSNESSYYDRWANDGVTDYKDYVAVAMHYVEGDYKDGTTQLVGLVFGEEAGATVENVWNTYDAVTGVYNTVTGIIKNPTKLFTDGIIGGSIGKIGSDIVSTATMVEDLQDIFLGDEKTSTVNSLIKVYKDVTGIGKNLSNISENVGNIGQWISNGMSLSEVSDIISVNFDFMDSLINIFAA